MATSSRRIAPRRGGPPARRSGRGGGGWGAGPGGAAAGEDLPLDAVRSRPQRGQQGAQAIGRSVGRRHREGQRLTTLVEQAEARERLLHPVIEPEGERGRRDGDGRAGGWRRFEQERVPGRQSGPAQPEGGSEERTDEAPPRP